MDCQIGAVFAVEIGSRQGAKFAKDKRIFENDSLKLVMVLYPDFSLRSLRLGVKGSFGFVHEFTRKQRTLDTARHTMSPRHTTKLKIAGGDKVEVIESPIF
jgi:hypothetical protein